MVWDDVLGPQMGSFALFVGWNEHKFAGYVAFLQSLQGLNTTIERHDRVDIGPQPPGEEEVHHALKVGLRAHRTPDYRQMLAKDQAVIKGELGATAIAHRQQASALTQ